MEVAFTVSKFIPSEITVGKKEDVVHSGIMNEPDPYILNFWKTKITLEQGVGRVIEGMNT